MQKLSILTSLMHAKLACIQTYPTNDFKIIPMNLDKAPLTPL